MSPLDQPDPKTFLANLAPFNQLPETVLETLARELTVGFFQADEILLDADELPTYLYIVIDGMVWEIDASTSTSVQKSRKRFSNTDSPMLCVTSSYASEDVFGAKAILKGINQNKFIAHEPTHCFQLSRDLFLKTAQSHPGFAHFYNLNISRWLATQRLSETARELSAFTVAKIGEAYIHPPTYVSADTSIHDTAQAMKAHKTSSLLVRRGEDVGIVTATDLREAAIIGHQSVDAPIGPIANYQLICMEPDDFLFNALLRMTHYNINRLVIRKGNAIHGILEQIDLLSYLSNHSHMIALQIDRAVSKDDLRRASQNLVNVISDLHTKGIKISYIMQLVSELNKKMLNKLFHIIAPPELLENSCLLVMGSEGREEQIMKTDQDNALILRDDFECADLERITREFTESLITFGYPRCPGNIMVSNPYWTKSATAFKKELFEWIVHPNHEAFLQFAIYYDAIAVAGDSQLLSDVQKRMYALLSDHRSFYARFARATIAFETPLGFFTNFVVEKGRDELDIKKGGIFPIVHGIRSLALEYRLEQTNTVDRIQALSERHLFEPNFDTELIEAFNYMSTLRAEAGLRKAAQGLPQDNYLNPKDLNKMERELLRDSLKIVNELKKFITYHFKLGMLG